MRRLFVVAVFLAASPVLAAEPIPLAWKLKENDRLYADIHWRLVGRGVVETQESAEYVDALELVERYVVGPRTADGGLTLDMCLESLCGDNTSFAEPSDVKAIMGTTFHVVLNPDLGLRDSSSLSAFIHEHADAQNPRVADTECHLTEVCKYLTQDVFIPLPNKPTRPGDQWQRQERRSLCAAGWLNWTKTFTDAGDTVFEGRTLRKIRVTAVMTLTPPDADQRSDRVQFENAALSGASYEGTVLVDPAAGRVVTSEAAWKFVIRSKAHIDGKVLASEVTHDGTLSVRFHDHNPLVIHRPSAPPVAAMPPVANTIGMQFVALRPGKFWMGSPDDEVGRNGAETEHEVEITKPFYLGIHEVTVGQFRHFVEATGYKTQAETDLLGGFGWNPETAEVEQGAQFTWRTPGFEQTDAHPVVLVSWIDAKAFCDWLSTKEGRVYRLPTEAEWEYACRAGSTTTFHFGNDEKLLVRYANVADVSLKNRSPAAKLNDATDDDGYAFTSPVGSYQPNAWGLYDMHGNATEWCEDWFWQYDLKDVKDPKGPYISACRATRGGSWSDRAAGCRSAARHFFAPNMRNSGVGFRVVCENPKP